MIVGTACGAALAAVQLGLSWQLASAVGQTGRSSSELIYYSYPPLHWFEVVLPRLVRELRLGPEDPYWFGQQTWGYEAALYVGTIPVILAFVGLFGRPPSRSAALWRLLVPVSFALATMPRWWPQGYVHLLSLPGIGFFRAPGRYTLLTSLGLALLAGEGFDRAVSKTRFRLGLSLSLCLRRLRCGRCMASGPGDRTSILRLHSVERSTDSCGPVWPGSSRSSPSWPGGPKNFLPAVPVIALAIELGILFYASTTQWGWAVVLPRQSPVLTELVSRSPHGLDRRRDRESAGPRRTGNRLSLPGISRTPMQT